ncbi:hypothetical protein RZS08_40990, partial [Arthrospira platensis SPKY1]|nr:hypothetical protein [Arthrospira platensis SPKY1]
MFYGFISRSHQMGEANAVGQALGAVLWSFGLFAGILFLTNAACFLLERLLRLRRNIAIPVDLIVMRTVEIVESIPGLLLILSLAALIRKPSVWYVMLIIG